MMIVRIVNCIFIFLLTLSICEAELYCYVCTTASGLDSDKCGDDFRLTSVQALSCGDGSCLKTRGYRSEGGKRVVEVTRGCVGYVSSESCSKRTHYGITTDYCTCNTAYCNDGSTLIPSIKLSLSIVFGLIFTTHSIL